MAQLERENCPPGNIYKIFWVKNPPLLFGLVSIFYTQNDYIDLRVSLNHLNHPDTENEFCVNLFQY